MQSVFHGFTSRIHELTFRARTIERNLDSISLTPRIHREDLLRHVHRPECQLLVFDTSNEQDSQIVSSSLNELKALRDSLSFAHAMQRVGLQNNTSSTNGTNSGAVREQLAIETTVRAFCRKAEVMYESLGSWAADHYVNQTIRALEKGNDGFQDLFDAQGTNRQTLLTLFGRLRQQALSRDYPDPRDDNISSKVKCLMSFLLKENEDEPVGIVFVEQRATTSILAGLLQRHPATRDRFRCVPFVGTSNSPSRRYGLTELVDLKAQKETLGKFRAGEHNLIVATNALEEGIDVQSCNVVACFDPPANVKSFIQRRGRARTSGPDSLS